MTFQTMLDMISTAIKENKMLHVVYEKNEGEKESWRRSEPHVLFYHPSTKNLTLETYQHSGDSASERQWRWKKLLLTKIKEMHLGDSIVRSNAIGYNPASPLYANYIIKK
jgi:hypothetical protein